MKNKKLTGFLVDVLDELSGPITIDNSLEYAILGLLEKLRSFCSSQISDRETVSVPLSDLYGFFTGFCIKAKAIVSGYIIAISIISLFIEPLFIISLSDISLKCLYSWRELLQEALASPDIASAPLWQMLLLCQKFPPTPPSKGTTKFFWG